MSYDGGYYGEERLPRIEGFTSTGYTKLLTACNFEGDKIVVADSNSAVVNVWHSNTTAWYEMGNFNNVIPDTTTGFGISVAMDWDGNRIAIGANVLSNVYIYDYQNGNWNQRVIEGPPGTDFGYSVAIAGNNPDVICIGAPLGNNVHVYENIEGAWNETFRNNGKSIKNRLPVNSTSNVILKSEYTAYGFHVNISPSGEYIIAGAPGTYIPPGQVSSVHLSNYEVNGVMQSASTFTGTVSLGPRFYGFPDDSRKQIGNARVFKRNGSNWNISSAERVGHDIEGTVLGSAPWSAFGSCTYVSDDGVAIVSSPMYNFGTGKITRFELNEKTNIWEVKGFELNSQFGSHRYGQSFAVDYATGRIAATLSGSESQIQGGRLYPSHVHVHDWNGTEWFEAQPLITLMTWEDSGLDPNAYETENTHVSMVNGNRVICTSSRSGKVFTKHVDLTQNFFGNSLFSGYVMTPSLYVGANNSDSNNTSSKRISFGGTWGDQRYSCTTIESRTAVDNTQRSELFIFKRNESGTYDYILENGSRPDSIRLKANEIVFDSLLTGFIRKRTGFDTVFDYTQEPDGDYDLENPLMIMNHARNIALFPKVFPNRESGSPAKDFYSSCDAKASLDVGGTTLIKNNTIINYRERSDIKGLNKRDPHVFYDTRDTDVLYVENGQTRVKTYTWPGFGPQTIFQGYGLVQGPANGITYSKLYKSFEMNDATSNIHINIDPGGYGDYVFSCWLMLKNDQSNYNKVTVLSHKSKSATLECFKLQVTQTNVIMEFTYGSNVMTFTPTTNVLLEKNKWYCLLTRYFSDVHRNIGYNLNNTRLYINGVSQTLELSTNGSTFGLNFPSLSYTQVGGISNDTITNAYLGLYRYYSGYGDSHFPSAENIYNNGPPTEMLSVGGDAIIQRNLGVGVINPSEALEVSGNVHANYFVGDGSRLTNLQGGANTLQAVTDEGSSTNQTLYLTNTATSLVASGNVAINGSLDVGSVLNLTSGSSPYNPFGSVQATELTRTYIGFKEAGSANDWAYLRQIGGDNAYHMALDFHDDSDDGRFSIRTVSSATDDVVTTRFSVVQDGKVGINNANPTAFLHSNWYAPGDSNWYEIWKHTFDAYWDFSMCERHRPGADASFMFRNRAASVEYDVMTFLYDRVGINNTNPVYSLDVSGDVRANSFVGDASQLTNLHTALQDELQYSSGTYTVNPYTDNQDFIEFFNTQSGNYVTIDFTYFQVENNFDFLYFYYDSNLDLSNYTHRFTGLTTPNSITFNVPTGQWKVRFTSDTSVSGGSYGFSFKWHSYKNNALNLNIFNSSEPSIIFGSNTIWGTETELRVGSGGPSAQNTRSGYVMITNGNLHLDPCAGHDLFLCYYNSGSVYHTGNVVHTSDDRLKSDEKIIENATETLNKLVPQTYLKSKSLENPEIRFFEAGLIAQEIYYKCPELRHIVKLPKDAEPAESIEIPDDPQIDPDYSSWGTSEAAVNYTGLIPYMITAIQELDKKNKALEAQLASVLARLDALENPS